MRFPYRKCSEQFLDKPISALVPIFGERDSSIYLLGSGVFVRMHYSSVILTAGRINHFVGLYSLLMPGRESEIDLIGCLETVSLGTRKDSGEISDIAYFRVDATVAREMHPYSFKPLEVFAADELDVAPGGRWYSIIGYPRTPNVIEPQGVGSSTVTIACSGASTRTYQRMGVSLEDHLILRPAEKDEFDRMPPHESPQIWPYSLSGSGVFAWDKEVRPIEQMRPPRLVAIINKYHPESKIFTAVRLHHYFDHINQNVRPGIF